MPKNFGKDLPFTRNSFSKYFDHTLLKPDATKKHIERLCAEAVKHNFASVCVNPAYVNLASQLLHGSEIRIGTVVGFPLGANKTVVKVFETEAALKDGAGEIDMVIHLGGIKMRDYDLVYHDISEVARVCKLNASICKVIIETVLLTDDEKRDACKIIVQAGAHFVKTSTGFGPGGATVEDIRLLKQMVEGSGTLVKAAGGIRNYTDALKMIHAGASRLGTSATIKIMAEFYQKV